MLPHHRRERDVQDRQLATHGHAGDGPAEMHIVPGGHEWIVWDEQLPQMFARMAKLIPSMRKS